jgi:hypothetical protein
MGFADLPPSIGFTGQRFTGNMPTMCIELISAAAAPAFAILEAQ